MRLLKKMLIFSDFLIIFGIAVSICLNFSKRVLLMELGILIFTQLGTYYFFSKNIYNLLDSLHDLFTGPRRNSLEIEKETEFSALKNEVIKFTKIEEMKRMENEQSKKQIEKLISDISHQTKTPIANILLYSELLLELNLDEKKYIQTIIAQTEKLQWLVQSLLYLSRLENGIIQCKKEVCDVNKIIFSCIDQYKVVAEKKNLELIYEKACNKEISIFSDSKWSQEALSNIIENSIKYTNQGSIHIQVNVQEFFVCIIVTDTGIGISEIDLANIFQRFYRSQQVKQIQGVGIGLSLTREIMEKQGGYIIIESKADVGTKVKLFFQKEE